MGLSDSIRRRGFRRWHERQLIESHAYLVTGLLALIMMAIAIEMIDFRQSAQGLLALLLVGAGGFSYEEAAQVCGVPTGTIKSRVARGRAQLMAMLTEESEPSGGSYRG